MDAVLRTLSDESRRMMLESLRGGPATAGELAALLPIARPGVSRHLRVLRKAGLVEARQEAQRRVYSLRPGPLTDSRRLARWIAEVAGDLRLGGEFHARFTSGWDGPGRVDVCEPPRRLLLRMCPGQEDETVIEAHLAAAGDQTSLVIEERGLPRDELAAHGAGWQAHVEDLAAHVTERKSADWRSRWTELTASYQALADNLS
jgi:DNA-binding transcriptional ArsR family regulator